MRLIPWGAPSGPPKPPQRSSRPGQARALLDNGLRSRALSGPPKRPNARRAPAKPGHSSICRAAAVVAAIGLVAGCASTTGASGAASRAATRTLLNPQWLGAPPADFTQTIAVSGGQTVYVSAQTAWDPNQNAVVGP